MPSIVHRFDKEINGREYLIEVAPVGNDRWRAHLLTAYGGSRAPMPFYGQTPDDAAERLAVWLARAHRNIPNPV